MRTNAFASRKLAAAAAVALAMVAASRVALADPLPRSIRVSGEGVVKAAPDRARIAVSVISQAPTARAASESNAVVSKAVLEKLRAAVKPPGEVSTAGYDLAPQYDYNQDQGAARGPVLIGYAATNRFSIVTSDLAGVGALVDAAVDAGAKQIDSIGWYLDDETAPRKQALLAAGRKARAEAETIAESLGLALGEVTDASSVANVTPMPVFARERMAMVADSAAAPTEMVPGSLEVRGTVTVTFAIR